MRYPLCHQEGRSLTAVKTTFERDGIPTPRGARYWTIATIKRIAENDVYLARPCEEVAALVSPEVAERLDPSARYGVYWFGRVHMERAYGRGSRKFTVEHNPREKWIAIPVPDCGIPPEWVLATRQRLAANERWSPSTHPAVRLRGRIRCACGYAMTNRQSEGRRYYVCGQHRKRGPCEHAKFHRLLETEQRVERFVLGLLENPDILREKVREQAERERHALRNTDREARRVRSRLEKLDIMEDGYSEQQAEGLLSMERLREKLGALTGERRELERRLADLADGERRIKQLEDLPTLVEAYLRDLPELVGWKLMVREYETVPAERTEENPLGVYTLSPKSIRHLPEEELAEKRRAAEEERSARFRDLYEALDLHVVCHKDLSLEVTWSGAQCPEWLGRTLTKPSFRPARARVPATRSTTTL